MLQSVTALLVVRPGSTRVQRTLAALAAQTRRPDAVVVIEVGSAHRQGAVADGELARAVAAFAPTHYLATEERLGFAAAAAAAARALPEPRSEHEWLWLLTQDAAPEPDALERLLEVVEVSPSVALAGPKLVDWDDRSTIRSYGVTMTRFGAAVSLVEDELDQAQHDRVSDVLGVDEVGALVRHGVWNELGGLDQGLPVVDGGLDLSTRARLAGHRVVVAPDARVAVAGEGLGPKRRGEAPARIGHGARRAAQLHRRMVYAPAAMLVLHWLSLVPLAVLRSIGWLLGKQPDAIGGELGAAFATAFGAGGVHGARRRLAAARRVGWGAIAPLRLPLAELRRRRALGREAALTAVRGQRREIDFFGTGGGWVLVAATVASVGLQARLLGASVIGGGGLLPLETTVRALWSGIGWGWRDAGVGFTGPSDPFNAVLAVLGSITFWQPSFALVLLWFAAMPLAALGAWLLATRFSARSGVRAVFALAWAFAPMLLTALHDGRPAAVLAHVLLPWLIFAAVEARGSWAASGAASILAAALVACSPSLIPALAVAWFVWTAASGRAAVRAVGVPIPAVALFLPLVVQQITLGHWLRILADPGAPQTSASAPVWQLLLGFPGGTVGGWQQWAESLGLPAAAPVVLLVVLVVPLVLLAFAALFLRGSARAAGAVLGALLGLATALVAGQLTLQTTGSSAVALWTGPALSLYWMGLTAAAALGLAALGRVATAPMWVAGVAVLIAIVPLAAGSALGQAAVVPHASGQLPAYVAAEAAAQPRTATLVITPSGAGALTAGIVHGTGETLQDQSTIASSAPRPTAQFEGVATLAANLVSRSGYDASAELKRLGISFVFVEKAPTADGAPLAARAAVALDANPLFDQVGTTASGTLWGTADPVAPAALPAHPGGWQQPLVLLMLVVVFGAALLLSIPTGRVGRIETRRGRRPRTEAPTGVTSAVTAPADGPEASLAPDAPVDEAVAEAGREPAFVGAGSAFGDDEDVEN